MKRYLFFLRHFNDIDNIAPVIYFYLKESESHCVDVVIYTQYHFNNDLNLNFLKEEFPGRIKITQLSNIGGTSHKARQAYRSVRSIIKRTCLKVIKNPDSKIYTFAKSFNKMLAISLKSRCVASDLNNTATRENIGPAIDSILNWGPFPKAVIFDIVRTGQVKNILTTLRSRGVSMIICLPVSPLINFNVMREAGFLNVHSPDFASNHDYSGFDKLGFVDEHFAASYNNFFDSLGVGSDLEGKTTPLGSIRYCRDWLTIRNRLSVKKFSYECCSKVKIVFLFSRLMSNVDIEELKRTFVVLEQFDDIDVIVKPHTRSDIEEIFRHKHLGINYVDGSDYDSSELMNWADIVLFWSTSVAIEGYIRGKIMICLKYLVSNLNLYAKYDAGLVANCRDDLFLCLCDYIKSGQVKNYNFKGCNEFIRDIVYRGDFNNDIPKKYLDFIRSSEFG